MTLGGEKLSRFFLTIWVLTQTTALVWGATQLERRDFSTALRWFQGGWWEKAESALTEFIQKYPNSDLVPEAIVKWAQTKLKMGDPNAAYSILTTNMNRLGAVEEQALLTLGDAAWAAGDYENASIAFGRVWERYPGSVNAPTAAYNQALALSKLHMWDKILQLVSNPVCPLYSFITLPITNQLAIDTKLLLVQTLVSKSQFDQATNILAQTPTLQSNACTDWQRYYLLTLIELEKGNIPTALSMSSNLFELAKKCESSEQFAQSLTLQTRCYLLGANTNSAIQTLEQLLNTNIPAHYRRWALITSVELALRKGQTSTATELLDQYGADNNLSDALLLTSAELSLFQAEHNLARTPTRNQTIPENIKNLLYRAIDFTTKLETRFPSSPTLSKALLIKGWALWHLGDLTNSLTTLKSAAQKLAYSDELPLILYKIADAQYQIGEFHLALTNYIAAIEALGRWPSLKTQLLPGALYQALSCAIKLDQPNQAQSILERILQEPTVPDLQAKAFFFWGLYKSKSKGKDAIAILEEFCKRFPESSLVPEAQLLLARLYEYTGDYITASKIYENWVQTFTNHTMLHNVQLKWAVALAACNQSDRALSIMRTIATNTHHTAAVAQYWIADYYTRQGDLALAEQNFQLVFHRWPNTQLSYKAKLNAARVAAARLGYEDAVKYCLDLANDTNTPPDIVAESLFLYGDVLTKMPSPDPANPYSNVEEAIRVFSKIIQLYPTNELAIRAQGRIGDCYLLLGGLNPAFYENALATYASIITNHLADASARSQAEVGLGMVLEKLAKTQTQTNSSLLTSNALYHYLRVVYGENLKTNESPAIFWVKEAAIRAAKIMDDLNLETQSTKLIEYLGYIAPDLARFISSRTKTNTAPTQPASDDKPSMQSTPQ